MKSAPASLSSLNDRRSVALRFLRLLMVDVPEDDVVSVAVAVAVSPPVETYVKEPFPSSSSSSALPF